jgi:hypothetical protein
MDLRLTANNVGRKAVGELSVEWELSVECLVAFRSGVESVASFLFSQDPP